MRTLVPLALLAALIAPAALAHASPADALPIMRCQAESCYPERVALRAVTDELPAWCAATSCGPLGPVRMLGETLGLSTEAPVPAVKLVPMLPEEDDARAILP